MDYLENCVFISESGFDINMRPSHGRSIRGTPAMATALTTKAESYSILGAISAVGVANIDVRIAQTRKKKIKVAGGTERKKSLTKRFEENWYCYWALSQVFKGNYGSARQIPEHERLLSCYG
ncbi:hypothetical protein RMATCC62417_13971 [Rhizopus microsporus]|nr:hypothetical protein RMATCC62417_13971 [Rhizopus microsporus]